MSELAPLVNAQYGVFYVTKREEEETKLELVASYGAEQVEELKKKFSLREGLVGQAAADKRPILLKDVPADFLRIGSGLGHAKPANVNILPALFEDEVKAVIELASFSEFNETHQSFLDQLDGIGRHRAEHDRGDDAHRGPAQAVAAADAGAAGASDRTHHASRKSCTTPTRSCRKRRSCSRTRRSRSKRRISRSRWLAGRSRKKPSSSALTSKYKSEFLANMTHELRTPLNSLLILSKLLSDNAAGQPQRQAGRVRARRSTRPDADLLNLINDILDLSKIESGTVSIEVGEMPMRT